MFDIDVSKKYGILLSGGLDSAILLALILKYYPNINIQPFTIPKHDGASLYVNNIIAHLNNKCNTSIGNTIYVGNPNVYHRLQSTTAIMDIFKNHSIDFIFNALNKNPQELENVNGAPNRIKKSEHPRFILPFVDLTKDKILSMMYDHNLEDLIDITHSCTEQQTSRCNKCWQCQERQWAFKQLNKIDTGTK